MAGRKIKQISGRFLVGQRVAVSFNRHECLVAHPRKKGEHCFPVRRKPNSGDKVLGYADQVWLEDVSFFISPSGLKRIQETGTRTVCCFVVGTVISNRSAKVTGKRGWSEIRLDVFDDGCFYKERSGRCVRTAKYARLRNRKIEAFGTRSGEAVASMRELNPRTAGTGAPTYGPRREAWRGEMGGVNYEPASADAIAEAIRWVFSRHPDACIVDGTDDWDAPDKVRPEILAHRYGLEPYAWWHTGKSGQSRSGVVLPRSEYDRLRAAYRREFGCDIEDDPEVEVPALVKPACGCWQGEGIRVYCA